MMNECRQDDDSATIKVYQMDAEKDDCLVFIKEYHLDDDLAMMKAHQIDAPKDDCLLTINECYWDDHSMKADQMDAAKYYC